MQRDTERFSRRDLQFVVLVANFHQRSARQKPDACEESLRDIALVSGGVFNLRYTIQHNSRGSRRFEPFRQRHRVNDLGRSRRYHQFRATNALPMPIVKAGHLQADFAIKPGLSFDHDGSGELCSTRPFQHVVLACSFNRKRWLQRPRNQYGTRRASRGLSSNRGGRVHCDHRGDGSGIGRRRQLNVQAGCPGRND